MIPLNMIQTAVKAKECEFGVDSGNSARPYPDSYAMRYHVFECMHIAQRPAKLHEERQRGYGREVPIMRTKLADRCASTNLE